MGAKESLSSLGELGTRRSCDSAGTKLKTSAIAAASTRDARGIKRISGQSLICPDIAAGRAYLKAKRPKALVRVFGVPTKNRDTSSRHRRPARRSGIPAFRKRFRKCRLCRGLFRLFLHRTRVLALGVLVA